MLYSTVKLGAVKRLRRAFAEFQALAVFDPNCVISALC